MKLLLTGFEPFGGESLNSSWELLRPLRGERVGGLRIDTLCLPCRFASSLQVLGEALKRQPALVLCVGQAASRQALSFERVAVNWVDARIADNDGQQPIDQPVIAGAPPAYFARLPLKTMVAAAQAAGVPAEISFSAGSFVCNQVFFGLQHALRRRRSVRSGFLHVPALDGALSLDAMREGLLAALAVAGEEERPQAGGRLD